MNPGKYPGAEPSEIPGDALVHGISADSKNEFCGIYQIIEHIRGGYEADEQTLGTVFSERSHYKGKYYEGREQMGEPNEEKVAYFDKLVGEYNTLVDGYKNNPSPQRGPEELGDLLDKLFEICGRALELYDPSWKAEREAGSSQTD